MPISGRTQQTQSMKHKQDPQAVAALETFIPGGWEAIQAAQQGKPFRPAPIDLSKPARKPATDNDRALLVEHGAGGLRALQLWGVLDRLGIPFSSDSNAECPSAGRLHDAD